MEQTGTDRGQSIADPWYQTLFEGNPQPMYIYDAATFTFLTVNRAAVKHYGYSLEEFLTMTAMDIRPPEDIPGLMDEVAMLQSKHSTGFQKSHVRKHRLKNGQEIFVETSKQLLKFNGREAVCVLVNDVTERELAEQLNQHLAYYDELTDLPNRARLRMDLQAAIDRSQKTGHSFALLVVELLRFREINYTLGHMIGDELLKQVAGRLSQVVGEQATAARISNVQFGVLLEAGTVEAIQLTRELLDALEEPLLVGGISYELGGHVGIAFFPGHGTEPGELIRHADIALFQARKAGREYSIYNADEDPYSPRRLALLGDFRRAIKEGQLQLYCQPKADIRSKAISSAEALVRWQHPQYGLIAPDQFIPLVEPTELIQPLTQWVLEAAIQQCYEWRRQGLRLPLAVNLSARNLMDAALPETINALMQAWGADTTWMGLEITESSIMSDPVASLRVLNQLHQLGFTLFVDDFGTGYSSLSYLMKLPVDVIKIDHSFTMNMIADSDAAAIVKSTIEMGHNMGMKVVAEGTASREIWEALVLLGCDEGQGEYISPPLPAKDMSMWLAGSAWGHPAAQAI